MSAYGGRADIADAPSTSTLMLRGLRGQTLPKCRKKICARSNPKLRLSSRRKKGQKRSGRGEITMPDMPTTTLIFTWSLIGLGLGVALAALQVWFQGDVQSDAFDDNPRPSMEDPRIELEARGGV